MNFSELPFKLSKSRAALYLSEEKQTALLNFLNSLPAEVSQKLDNHSDVYFYLMNRKDNSEALQKEIDMIHIQNAEIYNALQSFGRKISAELTDNTDGLFSRTLTMDEVCEAMQDYSHESNQDENFPTEKFVEKLLTNQTK